MPVLVLDPEKPVCAHLAGWKSNVGRQPAESTSVEFLTYFAAAHDSWAVCWMMAGLLETFQYVQRCSFRVFPPKSFRCERRSLENFLSSTRKRKLWWEPGACFMPARLLMSKHLPAMAKVDLDKPSAWRTYYLFAFTTKTKLKKIHSEIIVHSWTEQADRLKCIRV